MLIVLSLNGLRLEDPTKLGVVNPYGMKSLYFVSAFRYNY